MILSVLVTCCLLVSGGSIAPWYGSETLSVIDLRQGEEKILVLTPVMDVTVVLEWSFDGVTFAPFGPAVHLGYLNRVARREFQQVIATFPQRDVGATFLLWLRVAGDPDGATLFVVRA